jgi:hypothetical protein
MADQTTRIKLLGPVLDQGIRNTNFFNGRLLTAADLQTEQDADRSHRAQLSQAIGHGVVTGLVVTLLDDGSGGGAPVVRVSGGLALNRCGQALALPTAAEVVLSSQADPLPPDAGLFAPCVRPPSAPGTDRGVFLLVLSPSSGYREQAPRRDIGPDASVNGCGPRYTVEGVSFRLETFDPSVLKPEAPATVAADLAVKDRTDAAGLSLHRNLLAHLCFGTESLASFAGDPFRPAAGGASPFDAYGAVDALRAAGGLTDCEVPLALIFWPASGVKFLDAWSVRRRVIPPLVGDPWPPHVGQRRLAEAEAVFLQFQDQVRDLLGRPSPGAVTARDHFGFLPPAGYLPVSKGEFTLNAFFNGLTVNSQTLDRAFLRLLVQQSWYLDPINLASPPALRVYAPPGQPGYLLFVRDENVPAPAPPTPPPPGPTPTTGRINVVVSLLEAGAVSTPGRLLRKTDALDASLAKLGIADKTVVEVPVQAGFVQVYAVDALGHEYPAQYVPQGARSFLVPGEKVLFRQGVARYTIPSLPAGDYTVSVKALGFKTASQHAAVTAGQSTQVGVVLVPDTGKVSGPSRAPARGVDGSWIKPGWFGKAFVVDSPPKWPWPPEPDAEARFNTVVDPPLSEVEGWVEDWANYLHAAYPDAPLDPGGARLVVSGTHTPDQVADQPYAYLVFGDSGAYAPVVLTAKDKTLDRPVSLASGDLPGVELGAADRFRDLGVTSLDMLAAGWTGLVSEVLGVGARAAGSLISSARNKVEALQGTLRVFGGVDATLEKALKDAGIDGPAALANADPQALTAKVGAAQLTPALAQLLVDEARGVVPASQWSLHSPQLGLKEDEVATLQAQGITTLGQLLTRTKDDAGKAAVGGVLGIPPAQVGALVGRVVIPNAASLAAARLGQSAVTGLVGIDRGTGLALAHLGFGSAGALAKADPLALASAFGGDTARAAAAIQAAQAHVGGAP